MILRSYFGTLVLRFGFFGGGLRLPFFPLGGFGFFPLGGFSFFPFFFAFSFTLSFLTLRPLATA